MSPLDCNEARSSEAVYITFAEELLALIAPWVAEAQECEPVREYLEFTDTGWQTRLDKRINYRYILSCHDDERLFEIPSAVDCASRLAEEGVMSDLPPKFAVGELLRSVVWLLERHGTPELTQEQLSEAYRSSFCGPTAPALRRLAYFPLVNFQGPDQAVGIDDHLVLSPFTPDEKTEVWGGSPVLLGTVNPSDIFWSKFKLVGTYWHTLGTIDNDCPDVRDAVGFLITALRLIKRGHVGIALVSREASLSIWQDGMVTHPIREYQVPNSSNTYELGVSDIDSLLTTYGRLRSLVTGSSRSLQVALRRFNQSYERRTGEDRIIDLSIALESTLLAGTHDELKHRLALRGAALLCQDEEPRCVKRLIEAMYDVRSLIVHEGAVLSDPAINKRLRRAGLDLKPADFADRCEDLARKVLREYVLRLAQGQSIRTVNQEIDDLIMRRLGDT